ncbi:MAG: DUF2147 domain-containing protein [Nitrospiraceae bacterium]|nr:DUF2147 domain-containing protein [Nitrospiraceae bacterium]
MAKVAHGAADDILGLWKDAKRDAIVRIYKCGDRKGSNNYCGSIAWVKDGPPTDIKNPDPALRGRPIQGLEILKGFSYEGKDEWAGGTLYDPKTGSTYKGHMRLASPDRLRLKGYVLLPLFGRTTTWTRARGMPPGPGGNGGKKK